VVVVIVVAVEERGGEGREGEMMEVEYISMLMVAG
jgi:hypothetical protein